MTTQLERYKEDAGELRVRLHSLILGYSAPVVLACLGAQTEAVLEQLPPGEREWATLRHIRMLAAGILDGDEDGAA